MAGTDFTAFIARVNELLSYDGATGEFRWKIGRPGASKGALAGTKRSDGYLQVCVSRQKVLAHRLAFMIAYGREPVGGIDHINRIRSDNRLANLREATKSQNGANKIKCHKTADGLKGASWCRTRQMWRASIRKNGRHFSLGYFATAQEAHASYVAAATELHGEFARAA